MIDSATLVSALKTQVTTLENDLRQRVDEVTEIRDRWQVEYRRLFDGERTASSWTAWRDDRITQAAVAWVLMTVFIRFCEDNRLVRPVWIVGPPERRQEALDAQLAYFRSHPEDTDREWLLEAVNYLKQVPATASLVDDHSPLWSVSPSGNAVTALLSFWRERNDDGDLIFDFTDPDWETRFLGDLYQDLSDHAKKTYALLQTPEFVEEFILDQTMEPALAERRLDDFSMIDPACGSGHFLLGAFRRLLDRWDREAPALELQQRVQNALHAVHGVDINPFAVAIATFRLTVDALNACGLKELETAPGFTYHLAAGDSLLFGRTHETLDIEGPDYDQALSSIAYSTEDLGKLKEILEPDQYDVVVGNPPYITVKDKKLNKAYRERYNTCKGTYALTVPFMERFFDLAKRRHGDQPPGWVGQITSNSFMKREFGSRLVEDFLPTIDLTLIIDTSGAYIPGHGTPTAILVSKRQSPILDTVRLVSGIRGEPERPVDPSAGVVWDSIVSHLHEPGYINSWVSVLNVSRNGYSSHPWRLSATNVDDMMSKIENVPKTLRKEISPGIGRAVRIGCDDAFVRSREPSRCIEDSGRLLPYLEGEDVRDYAATAAKFVWYPYLDGKAVTGRLDEELWRYRTILANRATFNGIMETAGRHWWEYQQHTASAY